MFKFTTKQFASLAVFLLATASPSVLVSAQIGGETDDNGCLIGAGESFCETTNSCIGPNDTCPDVMPGGDVDENGCKPSAGERFCETTNSWDKTTVGALNRHLIDFATAREAIATRQNYYNTKDKTHEKQSRVALHQKRFRYVIKI